MCDTAEKDQTERLRSLMELYVMTYERECLGPCDRERWYRDCVAIMDKIRSEFARKQEEP